MSVIHNFEAVEIKKQMHDTFTALQCPLAAVVHAIRTKNIFQFSGSQVQQSRFTQTNVTAEPGDGQVGFNYSSVIKVYPKDVGSIVTFSLHCL